MEVCTLLTTSRTIMLDRGGEVSHARWIHVARTRSSSPRRWMLVFWEIETTATVARKMNYNPPPSVNWISSKKMARHRHNDIILHDACVTILMIDDCLLRFLHLIKQFCSTNIYIMKTFYFIIMAFSDLASCTYKHTYTHKSCYYLKKQIFLIEKNLIIFKNLPILILNLMKNAHS